MNRTVKWGILAPGKIARSFASDFKYVKSGELVAVASRSGERAQTFAEEFDIPLAYGSYDELIEDKEVECLYIATPHNSHFALTKKALLSGKSVLCEKPITITVSQLEELIIAHKHTGQYLMEGMWTYFLPPIQKAIQWISEGKIGNVQSVESSFGFAANYAPEGRLFNPKLAGGSVYDVGIYPIAMAQLILGNELRLRTKQLDHAPTGVDFSAIFELQDEKNKVARLSSSLKENLSNETIITGDQGEIRIPDFWKATECILQSGKGVEETFRDPRTSLGYNFETEAVCQDILAGKEESSVVPLSTSLLFQKLIERVLE
jgi:predicted dehydrogenase